MSERDLSLLPPRKSMNALAIARLLCFSSDPGRRPSDLEGTVFHLNVLAPKAIPPPPPQERPRTTPSRLRRRSCPLWQTRYASPPDISFRGKERLFPPPGAFSRRREPSFLNPLPPLYGTPSPSFHHMRAEGDWHRGLRERLR